MTIQTEESASRPAPEIPASPAPVRGGPTEDPATISPNAPEVDAVTPDAPVRAWWMLLPLTGLAVLMGSAFWGFSYDDAFITYRYARTWAETGELAFNLGEPVLGTTAPGLALALGALHRLTAGIGLGAPQWGTVLSLLALLALAFFFPGLIRRGHRRVAVPLTLLYGLLVLTCRWNVELLGGEALACTALTMAAVDFSFRKDRQVPAGVCIAAAFACRADSLLAAGAIGLVHWVGEKRFPRRFVAIVGAGILAWTLYLTFVFDSPIPNTLSAKRSELATAWAVTGHSYSASEWRWLERAFPQPVCLFVVALAAAGLVLGWRRQALASRASAAVALWLGLTELAYHVLRVPFAPWYHVAAVNALLFLAALGALLIGDSIVPVLRGGALARRVVVMAQWAVPLVLLLPLLLVSVLFLRSTWGRPSDPRYDIYATIGRHIEKTSPPASTVAAVEIGVLGYFSNRRVLDLVGLVSPAVLRARREDGVAGLMAGAPPCLIVDNPTFHQSFLRPFVESAVLKDRYRAAEVFSSDRYPAEVRLLRLDIEECRVDPTAPGTSR